MARSLKSETLAAEKLIDAIRPMLAGKPPIVVGAALADLLAIWLASHVVTGSPGAAEATEELRGNMLALHLEAVKALVPINHNRIHGEKK